MHAAKSRCENAQSSLKWTIFNLSNSEAFPLVVEDERVSPSAFTNIGSTKFAMSATTPKWNNAREPMMPA